MKREEAEKLAADLYGIAWSEATRAASIKTIASHILSAYRKGETDMRERCAKRLESGGTALSDTARNTKDIPAIVAGSVGGIWWQRAAEAIRALTDDDQGNPEGEAGRTPK